jgi:phosphoenolpyruvate carboxykinase (GTP)
METNPNAMLSCRANTIFTNVGLTPDGDVWWEGIGTECPEGTITWKNKVYDPASGEPVAHPNARFTAPAYQCPAIDSDWENPAGVPISAFLFGGRRPSTVPLIHEARSWQPGVFWAPSFFEVTAAAIGLKAGVRRDPFAMLPFCGYHMGDYFAHWLKLGKAAKDAAKLPKIFYVNWFRKDNGKFLWPGYGENSRVLAYIFDRCNGQGEAVETVIGKVPAVNSIPTEGLEGMDTSKMEKVLAVNKEEWKDEVALIEEHYARFGNHLPAELSEELAILKKNLA